MIVTAEKIDGRWVLPLPDDLHPANGRPVRFRVEPEDEKPTAKYASNEEVLAAGRLACEQYAEALTNLAK